jgi:hypothetical protein
MSETSWADSLPSLASLSITLLFEEIMAISELENSLLKKKKKRKKNKGILRVPFKWLWDTKIIA